MLEHVKWLFSVLLYKGYFVPFVFCILVYFVPALSCCFVPFSAKWKELLLQPWEVGWDLGMIWVGCPAIRGSDGLVLQAVPYRTG